MNRHVLITTIACVILIAVPRLWYQQAGAGVDETRQRLSAIRVQ
jgi:hypothetical protein